MRGSEIHVFLRSPFLSLSSPRFKETFSNGVKPKMAEAILSNDRRLKQASGC